MSLLEYPKNIDLSLNFDQHQSLGELLSSTERLFSERTALINYDGKMTYRAVAEKSAQLRDFLITHCAIQKGDRVALFMPNIMQFIIMANAALKAGAIVVNINPLYTPAELSHVLQDAKPKVIVLLENFAHVLADVDESLHPEHIIVTEIGDCFSWAHRFLLNNVVRYIKRLIPPYKPFKRVMSWLQACTLGQQSPQQINLDIKHSDIAFLQYTGGTTGAAKGAMLTHGNMIANITQATTWVKAYFPDEIHRVATPLPLYHIFSLTANFLTFYVLGTENLLITNPRDLKSFIRDWKKYPVQAIAGVNTLFNALTNHPLFHTLPLKELKLALGGGMTVQSVVAERWQEQAGIPIIQAYGLTEASPAVCINPLTADRFTGSIGLPLPETEIKIVNESGEQVNSGEFGELIVKGPQVMLGYWNQPEETASVLTPDHWLKTGDIGYQDDKGYVYLVDRKKDLIIISGFNVYPTEIEGVLIKHPSIKEVAVIGVFDAAGLESIQACCVLKEGYSFDTQALEAFCRLSLTAYKIPKIYVQLREIPKSNVGKILKKELKKDIQAYLLT